MTRAPCSSGRAWLAGWVLMAVLSLHANSVHAAVACTASTAGATLASYDSTQATNATVSGSVTVSCSRTKSGDPTLVYVSVGVDGGLNLQGSQSRAQLTGGTSYLNYALWQNAAATLPWTNVSGTSGTRLRGQVNFGASTVYSASTSIVYYLTVPATQAVPIGVYGDTQTMSLYTDVNSAAVAASDKKADGTSPVAVQVSVVEACVLSSPPGNLSFVYTSFQTQAAVSSTSFSVRCPTGSIYSLSLDAIAGTLLGLNYSLALSPTGSRTGTGAPQSATITGTVASGQSGTCTAATCQASEARTLTITY